MKYLEYFDKFKGMEPYFKIDKAEWKYVTETFKKEDVRHSIATVLMEYPLPYANISLRKVKQGFKKLCGFHQLDLIATGEWFARGSKTYKYPLTINGTQKYFRRVNTGNDVSNYFQQKNRWTVDGSAPGPQTTWSTLNQLYSLIGSAYSLKVSHIDDRVLRTMIALRKYICAQFKPNVAKVIYDMYKAKNILDFSAGWGDRLAGFYASDYGEFYLGIDPKVDNHPIYKEQAKYYDSLLSMFSVPKTAKFEIAPAEDFDYSEYNEFFDIVFTSPPYFTTEKYSNEDTQSWIRYSDIDRWNKYFLHEALGRIWKTLKPGGHMLINISDVQSGSAKGKMWLQICDPMIDFLTETFYDASYVGCYGMEMATRPNNPGAGTATEKDRDSEEVIIKSGVFAEPVWVIKKEL